MLYHLPGLVNIQKANWKDPPCYLWVNPRTFDWAMFNGYVNLPEGTTHFCPFRVNLGMFPLSFTPFLDATTLTCLKKTITGEKIPLNYRCIRFAGEQNLIPAAVTQLCLLVYEPNNWLDIYSGWWYTYPSEKYESQLGSLFPIYGKKNVPSHQPVFILYHTSNH